MEKEFQLNNIPDAIENIRQGKVVIVVDDEDRENEGDFICAAECIRPEVINFMTKYGRGLICAPITESRAVELNLKPMVQENTSLHTTAFTVSVDLIGRGCTTGISAYDRSTGIKALADLNSKSTDFARPGHIFPLIAKNGGVLRRAGHTEAAIDLARLPQLVEMAKTHDLKIISIKDLIAYRMQHERLVKLEESFDYKSKWGNLKIYTFRQINTRELHFAIIKGSWTDNAPVLVRVYSSSETGDLLGLMFGSGCMHLENAMRKIAESEAGLFLWMRHKPKYEKVKEFLQNLDQPVQSNEQRNYGVGAQILHELKVRKIKLLTDHPRKRIGLTGYDLEILEYVPIQ